MNNSPREEVEAHTAGLWHRGSSLALVTAIVAYLLMALLGGPRVLEIIFVVAAFLSALGYMATTIWVYSLRTERKRGKRIERKEEAEESEEG